MLLVTFLFAWFTPLDVAIQDGFFASDALNPWPLEAAPICRFFYYAAPVAVGVLAAGSLGLLILSGFRTNLGRFRIYAICILLSGLLGPGLVVNAILKDYTGRPRPRQIQRYGGEFEYLRPLELRHIGIGKSFPAGHASVGFLFSTAYFLLKRHRRRSAFVALGFSLLLGGGMGVCRMVAGAHFFSDVIASGCITFLICGFTYHHLLRIPEKEQSAMGSCAKPMGRRELAGWVAAAVAVGGILLLATPHHQQIKDGWPDGSVPSTLRIAVEAGSLEILFEPDSARHGQLEGEVRGFGLPRSRLRPVFEKDALTISKSGFYTELDARFSIHLDPARVLSINVVQGDVRVKGPAGPVSLKSNSGFQPDRR